MPHTDKTDMMEGALRIETLEGLRLEDHADGSIRALDIGNLLEKVDPEKACPMLEHLARKIAPDGMLQLTVVDFDQIVGAYKSSRTDPETMLFRDGRVSSLWNRAKLGDALNLCGFEIEGGLGGHSWATDGLRIGVRARRRSAPIPSVPMNDVEAIMSMPRIAWTETMAMCVEVCAKLGMNFTKSTGVFWGQCLERMLEMAEERGTKYVLTIDYDSIFDPRDVVRLWQIMEQNPDIAALCPTQISREKNAVLVSIEGVQTMERDGLSIMNVPTDLLWRDAFPIIHGHFGLTMIRMSALKDIPHPWFIGHPNADGRWHDGRTDDDIHFWRLLRKHGQKVCMTPKVKIGHLQLLITWPTEDLGCRHQYLKDFNADGRPDGCRTY